MEERIFVKKKKNGKDNELCKIDKSKSLEYIQSAKILLLPLKCKIIFGTFKNGNFFNITIAILDFSLLLPI